MLPGLSATDIDALLGMQGGPAIGSPGGSLSGYGFDFSQLGAADQPIAEPIPEVLRTPPPAFGDYEGYAEDIAREAPIEIDVTPPKPSPFILEGEIVTAPKAPAPQRPPVSFDPSAIADVLTGIGRVLAGPVSVGIGAAIYEQPLGTPGNELPQVPAIQLPEPPPISFPEPTLDLPPAPSPPDFPYPQAPDVVVVTAPAPTPPPRQYRTPAPARVRTGRPFPWPWLGAAAIPILRGLRGPSTGAAPRAAPTPAPSSSSPSLRFSDPLTPPAPRPGTDPLTPPKVSLLPSPLASGSGAFRVPTEVTQDIEDRCKCEDKKPKKRKKKPSEKVANVRPYQRRMSEYSLANLNQGPKAVRTIRRIFR